MTDEEKKLRRMYIKKYCRKINKMKKNFEYGIFDWEKYYKFINKKFFE